MNRLTTIVISATFNCSEIGTAATAIVHAIHGGIMRIPNLLADTIWNINTDVGY